MKAIWLKMHPKLAYFPGDVCELSTEKFNELKKTGHVKEFIPEKLSDPVSDLPIDLPGHDALVAHGVLFMKDVVEIKDFTEIKGIGKSTSAQILKYLKK